MSLGDWNRALWYLSTIATVVLIFKLWKEQMLSRYPVLSVFLAWEVVTAVILMRVRYDRGAYAVLYFSFQAVTWALYVLTTQELMNRVLKKYPGFATLGRKLVNAALGGGAMIALCSMWAGVNYQPDAAWQTTFAMNLFLLGRVVCLTVLVFVTVAASAFAWFPLQLPANAVRFLAGYSVCFAARTAGYFAMNQRGFAWTQYSTSIVMVVVLICLIYWIVRLKAEGEDTELSVNHRWSSEEEQRMIEQIQSINSSLIRDQRK